ncbi:hypothetical protein A2U01_0090139, partial [Trifolium medium]|nr:hypothetical protein [Trifolium medium]
VEHGKTYSERVETVNGVKRMDLRQMRTTRILRGDVVKRKE